MPLFVTNVNTAYREALKTILGSDTEWIMVVFRWCVVVLVKLAAYLGITYEALNVWLFVILLPLLLMGSLGINAILWRRLRSVSRR